MSMFKQKPKAETPAPRAPSKSTPAAAGGLSIVSVGMTVRGDLESNGVVKVEGVVDGGVKATAQVLVAKGGVVHGDIETTDLVVGGAVNGAVRATGRVEVQAGASVLGDITTRRIFVAEGGSLNGQVRMGEGAESGSGERSSEGPPATRFPLPASIPVARMSMPPQVAGQG
jgi:cytoskeletal protein CcmA (bactofilin family)